MELKEIQHYSNTQEQLVPLFTPKVLIFPSASEVDAYAANRVKEQIQQNPESVLTLPTGNTPTGMYERLVALSQDKEVDMSRVTIFNLDEYYPIHPSHPGSYTTYMRRNLIDKVPIGQWYIPDGEGTTAEEESRRYKKILDSHQPVDLAILGLGPGTTCHIGFNEKGSSLDSSVRYVPLDPQTKATNERLFTNPSEIPGGTITQGIADILQAEEIIVIAKGASKAWGVERSLHGPVTADCPASFLRLHPHVTFLLDQEAAKEIITAVPERSGGK